MKAKEEFREWLVKWTDCSIQTGNFPCGTCTMDLLKKLGVKEDGDHNKPVDRLNEVWRGILQIREFATFGVLKDKGD